MTGALWQSQGPCRTNPDLFTDPDRVREAKVVCLGCPLKDECLEYALSLPRNPDGVYGATTQSQRRRIRAERKRAIEAAAAA
jgi:WhiB family redox-sensing transcriptional regulator